MKNEKNALRGDTTLYETEAAPTVASYSTAGLSRDQELLRDFETFSEEEKQKLAIKIMAGRRGMNTRDHFIKKFPNFLIK